MTAHGFVCAATDQLMTAFIHVTKREGSLNPLRKRGPRAIMSAIDAGALSTPSRVRSWVIERTQNEEEPCGRRAWTPRRYSQCSEAHQGSAARTSTEGSSSTTEPQESDVTRVPIPVHTAPA